MSQLIQLSGDLRGIVGLEWASVVDSAWKQKRKEIKSDKNAAVAFFQVAGGDGETLINYGLTDRQGVIEARAHKKDQPVSLAGLLALSNPQASVCVLERPADQDDLIWFCLSQNGQIVTGTDVIGKFDEIEPVLETYRDLIEDGGFKVIGNAADLLDPTVDTASVSDVLDSGSSGGATIDVGKEGLGVLGLVLVIGAFTSVVIAGYYIFLHGNDSAKSDMSAAEAAAMQRANAERAMASKKQEIREAAELQGTLVIMNQFLLHYAPKTAMGWSLTKARCADRLCTLEYQNENWSPVEVLAEQTEGLCDLAVTTNGEAAVCNAEYEVATLHESTAQKGEWLLDRPSINEVRRRLMEIAAHSGNSSFNLNKPVNINIPGSQFLQGEPVIAEVSLSLNTGLKNLDQTAQYLGDNLPIALSEAVYNFEDGIVQLKARFYVHGE